MNAILRRGSDVALIDQPIFPKIPVRMIGSHGKVKVRRGELILQDPFSRRPRDPSSSYPEEMSLPLPSLILQPEKECMSESPQFP